MTPRLSAPAIHRAVSDLLRVRPAVGLRLAATAVVALNASVLATFWVDDPWLFLGLCYVTALVYTAALMMTHDAIHHTLTGLYHFDEIFPRFLTYFLFWPHGLYSELHKMHHRMNGRDVADPEFPTPTRQAYEKAGRLARWEMRHRIWLSMFVYGGFGMLFRHVWLGLKLARTDARIKRLLTQDALGIAAAGGTTVVFVVLYGEIWRYAVYLLVLERVIGFFHQMRSHLEHYGLHDPAPALVEARLYNCRNVVTNPVVSRFFNGLNFHSVHHAFPAIPFYHLGTAHARIAALCEEAGRPLVSGRGYARTAWELLRAPSFVDGEARATSGGEEAA